MTGAHACGKSKAKLANPGVLHADPLPGRKDSSPATCRAPPDPESRHAGSGNCEACGQEGGTGRRRLHAPFVSTLPQMTGAESLRAARVSLSAGSSLTPRGERPTRQRPSPVSLSSPLAPTTTRPAQPWAQAFICTWPATNELGCGATCAATPGPGRTAPSANPSVLERPAEHGAPHSPLAGLARPSTRAPCPSGPPGSRER